MCDWFGTAHVLECPDGLHWNPLLSMCDLPSNVGCVDYLTTTVINSESTTMTSIAANSNMPISSTTEVGPEISTYSTTDKSVESTTSLNRVCIHVICPPYSPEISTYPTTDKSVESTTSLNRVYNLTSTTTESSTTEASSTDTTFTSPTTVTSSVSSTSSSSTSSTTSSNRVCSHVICPPYSEDPSIVTVFRHDADCSKYCMCDSDRIPHVMNCPDGLYWNKERRICDFRSNVVCGPSTTLLKVLLSHQLVTSVVI
ncbi:Chitin binding Peritrophin-A domain [Popillia japonica]|uniref:Chitin binding Peritrophin-A domain n=1 Tax=Popillia japonica TaxID=7064 RepID=A0AAW1MM98_POPJA